MAALTAAADSTVSTDAASLVRYHDTVDPIVVSSSTGGGNRIYEATTSIGLRPTQEDRFVLVPKVRARCLCVVVVIIV